MKIRKLLKNLDMYAYIKILEYDGSEELTLWEGDAYDCPWEIAEGIIDTDDVGAEGIFLDTKEDGTPCLCIYKRRCD